MEIKVIRSRRRHKTISARLIGETLEIQVPASLGRTAEQEWIDKIKKKFEGKTARRQLNETGYLQSRADELNKKYFSGKLRPASIEYVSNQDKRFGSCTPADATIRISHRMAGMPKWVEDYVIVHELAHLIEANHSHRFWQIVNRYPLTERARGYLMAVGIEDDSGE